jgi:hypothetical protein
MILRIFKVHCSNSQRLGADNLRSEAGGRIPRDCEDEIALREWGKCVIQTVCDLLYGIVRGKRDYRVAIGLSHCKMKVNSILTAARRPASERNVHNTIGVVSRSQTLHIYLNSYLVILNN